MHFVSDRNGNVARENSLQDKLLAGLYGSMLGRLMIRPFTAPAVSVFFGKLLDAGISKRLILPFIRSHAIDMEEYEQKEYRSYNDFFKRKIRPGARRIEQAEHLFISPCDSRLCVYKISRKSVFSIKNTRYTVRELLKNKKLADKFLGGYVWVFRLCVDDYHHYIYPAKGRVSGSVRINGIFHTVNPAANEHFPIYKENTREYCLLKTKNFKTILQMEVGALLVGKIENQSHKGEIVQRGMEKGNFAFGGSTVILMTQSGAVAPDQDILANSARGVETKVKMGEKIGCENTVKMT